MGGWKTRENVIMHFLDVDNLDFTRKNVEKKLDEKLVKKVGDGTLAIDNFDFPKKMSKDNVVKIEFWIKTWLRE